MPKYKKAVKEVEAIPEATEVPAFTLGSDYGRTDLNEAFAKIAEAINELRKGK